MMVAIKSHIVLGVAPPVAGVRRDAPLPLGGNAPSVAVVRAGTDPSSDKAPSIGGVEAPVRSPEAGTNSVAVAIFVSLILHAAVLAWSVHFPFAREAVGEEIVIEGISVILLDEVPRAHNEPETESVKDADIAVADSEMIVPDGIAAIAITEPNIPPAEDVAIADSEMTMPALLEMAAPAEPAPSAVAHEGEEATAADDTDVAATAGEAAPKEVAEMPDAPEARDIASAEPQTSSAPAIVDESSAGASPPTPAPEIAAAPTFEETMPAEVLAKDLPDNTDAPSTLDSDSVATDVADPVDQSVESAEVEVSAEEAETEVAVLPEPERIATLAAPPVLAAPVAEPVAAAPAPEREIAKPAPSARKKVAVVPGASAEPASKPQPQEISTSGQGGEKGGRVSASSYRAQLASHLRRYRSYPDAARAQGLWGTARVSFTVNINGQVTGARLTASSGHALLDRAAIGMVRRASPFPPIPRQVGISVLTVDVPVRFDRR